MAGGHEGCGVIEALGPDVKDFAVGDFVAVAYDGCGECEPCRRGDVLHCTGMSGGQRSEDGYLGNFGFADYCVRNTRSLIKMNQNLNPGEAAFLEPLATVVKGLKKLQVKPMETVAVIGAGTMGLLNALAARANGCRVIVSELMEKKLKTAEDMGFETINAGESDPVEAVKKMTGGTGADAVIVAVGITAANEQALATVFISLSPRPEMLMIMTGCSYPLALRSSAALYAPATAWELSIAGIMPSVSQRSLKALMASSSVAQE